MRPHARAKAILLTLAIVGGIAFALFGRELLARGGVLSFWFSEGVRRPAAFLGDLFRFSGLSREVTRLRLENENLRVELAAAREASGGRGETPREHLFAKVYSTYPLTNRSMVTVNAGEREGVASGAPVTVGGDHVLFGQVTEVFAYVSIVRTLMDEGWEIPVKVGAAGTDALFVGGREPRLTLVGKDASLREGDTVLAASRDFPYGLLVGRVHAVERDPAEAFQEASVVLPYMLGEVTEVVIFFE